MNAEYYVETSVFIIYSPRVSADTNHPPAKAATPPSARHADDVRERILDAARVRFVRYGFGKTTMAEIAADCGMSAANLYRYFASKGDIAAAGAEQWLSVLVAHLRRIAEDQDSAPGERLGAIVSAKLAALGDLVEGQPHLEELIEHVCQAREDIVVAHRAAMIELYTAIIEGGIASGDFDVADAEAAADAFQAGTMGFFHHGLICTVPFDQLRADAGKVVALLVRGLGRGKEGGVSTAIRNSEDIRND